MKPESATPSFKSRPTPRTAGAELVGEPPKECDLSPDEYEAAWYATAEQARAAAELTTTS